MENFENIHDMERQDTKHKLPAGWLLIFIGLFVFGIYYCAAFTPAISGWSQAKAYEDSLAVQGQAKVSGDSVKK